MTPAAARALKAHDDAALVVLDPDDAAATNTKPTRMLAFAPNYGGDVENDVSPVGFHESQLNRVLWVEANAGLPRLSIRITHHMDEGAHTLLEIEGEGFDGGGGASADDGRVAFTLPSRGTLPALADAFRYATDRGEANGFFDHLPDEKFSQREVRAQFSNEKLVRVYGDVVRALDEPATVFTPAWSAQPHDCDVCTPLRMESFTCWLCGYQGAPFVHGCKCKPSKKATEHNGSGTIDEDERFLQEHGYCQSRELRNGDVCERTGAFGDCMHGLVECPCCGGGDEQYDLSLIDPFERLKRIRAALEPFLAMDRAHRAEYGIKPRAEIAVRDAAPALERGVFIAPWRSSDGKRLMVAIAGNGRIVGQMAFDGFAGQTESDMSVKLWDLLNENDPVDDAHELHAEENAAIVEPVQITDDAVSIAQAETESEPESESDPDDAEPQARDGVALVGACERRVFEHNGESFTMYLTVPSRHTTQLRPIDRIAEEREGAWVDELREGSSGRAEAKLAEVNGLYLRAIAQIQAGRGAWDWFNWIDTDGSPRRGRFTDLDRSRAEGRDVSRDTHQSLAKLQEQYHEALSDYSIIPCRSGGLYLEEEPGDRKQVATPGLYADFGRFEGEQGVFSLVLGGRTNGKTGYEMKYEPDINVRVVADVGLQMLVADFLRSVRDRYSLDPADLVHNDEPVVRHDSGGSQPDPAEATDA